LPAVEADLVADSGPTGTHRFNSPVDGLFSGGLQAEKAVADLQRNGVVAQLHQQVLLGANGVPLRVSNRILDVVVGNVKIASRC